MHDLQDDSLKVTFQEENGQVTVELTDQVTGTIWGPTPAFTLDIMSLVLRRIEETDRFDKVSIQPGDSWIDVTLDTDTLFFSTSVTVRFAIDNGELVATIPSDRIVETRPELSQLFGVNILPALMRADAAAPGHLVLPYRNGAICYPKRHEKSSDRFMIYGEQYRWELMPMLPMCGAVRDGQKSALLALADQGECDAECRIDLDGQGSGVTGFSMRYRMTQADPVDPIDRIVRFVPLRGADAGYAGMGRRLHRYALAKCERGTLAERAAQNPDIAYAANSFVIKIMHACKEIGPIDGSGELRVFTTFETAAQKLDLIKQAGIDKLYVQLTGWNFEGHDGQFPTRFPVEQSLGGEEGLRKLCDYGRSLGFQMQVHDNYLDLMKRSPKFDPGLVVGDVYGNPLKRGCWAGGINYSGWPAAYPKEFLSGEMEKVKEAGAAGLFYIDAMGMPLEVSYNKDHGEHRTRRACAEGIGRIMRAGREVFGACGTENGFLYCVTESDYIGSAFLEYPNRPASPMVDMAVPLWFMATKGIAFCILSDTFGAAVETGNTAQTLSRRMLAMAEHGLMPRNEIVGIRGGWGYPLEPTLEAMKIEYDLMVTKLASICTASLDDHEILSGDPLQFTHVTRSRYSDGTEIVCDYEHNRLTINGEDYPLPNDYVKKPPMQMAWEETAGADAHAGIAGAVE